MVNTSRVRKGSAICPKEGEVMLLLDPVIVNIVRIPNHPESSNFEPWIWMAVIPSFQVEKVSRMGLVDHNR